MRACNVALLALFLCIISISAAVPVGTYASEQPGLRGRTIHREEASTEHLRYPSPVPPRSRRFDLGQSFSMQPRFGAESEESSEFDLSKPLRPTREITDDGQMLRTPVGVAPVSI
jgi:hypothetical protein